MSERIRAYKIVRAIEVRDLEKQINAEIEKGWVPQGGVFSAILDNSGEKGTIVVLQAMVKHGD